MSGIIPRNSREKAITDWILLMFKDVESCLKRQDISAAFKNRLIALLYTQGLTHSTRHDITTSILNEAYTRQPRGFNPMSSHWDLAKQSLHYIIDKGPPKGDQYPLPTIHYLPIISANIKMDLDYYCKHLLKNKLPSSYSIEYENLRLSDGRMINYLKIYSNDQRLSEHVYHTADAVLSDIAGIPTRDQLLAIIAEADRMKFNRVAAGRKAAINNRSYYIKKPEESILLRSFADSYEFYAHSSTSNDNNETLLRQIKEILQDNIAIGEDDGMNRGACKFYLDFINNVLNGLDFNSNKLKPEDIMKQELINSSLSRLLMKLKFSREAITFAEFILGIEFAVDEINLILALQQKYDAKDIARVARDTWHEQIKIGDEIENSNKHYGLSGSGLAALRMLIDAAKLHFLKAKNAIEPIIAFSENLYYEIPCIIGLPIEKKNIYSMNKQDENIFMDFYGQAGRVKVTAKGEIINDEQYLQYFESESEPESNDDADNQQIAHILVSAFKNNVSVDNNASHYNDVAQQIATQLNLRKEIDDSSQLIVIIDYTMNNITDADLGKLLVKFKDQINSGELAILGCHSFNKNVGIGLDKFFAGGTACFYNPKKFPAMQNLDSPLEGYVVSDPAIQSLCHVCKTNPAALFSNYFKMLQDNTQILYEEIIPKELYASSLDSRKHNDCDDYFTNMRITNPYNPDKDNAHTTPPAWNFIMITAVNHSGHVIMHLEKLLKPLGIYNRDGYGFAETSYSRISRRENIGLRISIGLDIDKEKFAIICDYIKELNDIYNKYYNYNGPRSNPAKKDSLLIWDDQINIQLSKLTKKYVEIANEYVNRAMKSPSTPNTHSSND